MICYSKDMVFLGEHVEKSCKAEMKGNKYTYSASKYLEWKQERKTEIKKSRGTSLVAQWLRIPLPGLPWWRSG